jgi:uncharacterized cupredoxin-like copper-binding protein
MRNFILLAGLLMLIPATPGAQAERGSETVVIRIHHSRFLVEDLEFERGDRVRFLVQNSDPIDHELIVGDEVVQMAHENGTEPIHGVVPGEVTIFAGEAASTTYRFDSPGKLEFACHYPGHYEYGMKGIITIRTS